MNRDEAIKLIDTHTCNGKCKTTGDLIGLVQAAHTRGFLDHARIAALSPVAAVAVVPDVDEAAEIISNLIANIKESGLYSKEATLTFLGQAMQCLRSANAPAATSVDAVPDWMPIETAPDAESVVVFWLDPSDPDCPERYEFDYMEDGGWMRHAELYDHFCCVASEGMTGPTERAPYTHWMRLGAPEVKS